MTFDVPILLITWRRADTTAKLINKLRDLEPSILYVASDGARSGNDKEKFEVEKTRQLIDSLIDWSCSVHKRYSPINQGCKAGVSNAINWFFEHNDEGIILEDDILPDTSFFPYCKELLEKYRNDHRIGSITGCNFQPKVSPRKDSYYFSRYVHVWGWATWRRAWQHNDIEMTDWPKLRDSGWLYKVNKSRRFSKFWERKFNAVYTGEKDTWDYAWVYNCWRKGFLSCTPITVLVENVGFGNNATHTMSACSPLGEINALPFPLIHPEMVEVNSVADWWVQNIHYAKPKGKIRRSFYLFIFKARSWLKAVHKIKF
jgi:hypothetical protein